MLPIARQWDRHRVAMGAGGRASLFAMDRAVFESYKFDTATNGLEPARTGMFHWCDDSSHSLHD